ncbi:hypothetical protein ACKVMT_02910 [Halobacteriales archaeon Cl-PHB]
MGRGSAFGQGTSMGLAVLSGARQSIFRTGAGGPLAIGTVGASFAPIVAPYAVRVLPGWVLATLIPLNAVLVGGVVLGQLLAG